MCEWGLAPAELQGAPGRLWNEFGNVLPGFWVTGRKISGRCRIFQRAAMVGSRGK